MPTHDFVADHGGVGDGQRQTVLASITSGTKNLAVDTAIFASGDVGKAILLVASGFSHRTTIATFTDSTHVVLAANAPAPSLSSASTDILWGTDNTTAFTDFNTWAIAQSGLVTLTCPAGRFCTQMDNTRRPFRNIPLVKLQGAGKATTIISQLLSGQLYFGGSDPIVHAALTHATGNSARIYTALADATTIRLKDISYASKFAAGRYIKLTGYDMQGINISAFGYPPNPFYYEDAIIQGISGDVITLTAPLTNTYRDTWPNWNSGNAALEADPGGPATIYIPDTSYDTEIELNDFTIDNPYFQSVAHGRRVVMNRILVTGGSGIYPTQNDYFEANDVDWPDANLEIDKINGTLVFNNCDIRILRFQSPSPDLCTITGGTVKQLIGAPKRLIIDGLTWVDGGGANDGHFQPGATSFGRTDEVQISNCIDLKKMDTGGAVLTGLHGGGVSASLPISNGLISFAKTENDSAGGQENPTRIFVPGTNLTLDNKLIIQVLDVYEDGINVYIQTSLTGGWPFTVTSLKVHPAPVFTMRNCAGTAPEIEDWNQATAGIPLYSYAKRTYVGGPASATPATSMPILWGRLVTAKLTVSTVYTGVGALTFLDGQFNNRSFEKLSDYTTASTFGATINMKLAGLRSILAASASSGGQFGDTLRDLSSTGEIWLFGTSNSFPAFSANVTNGETPTITVEYVMDQGIIIDDEEPEPVPETIEQSTSGACYVSREELAAIRRYWEDLDETKEISRRKRDELEGRLSRTIEDAYDRAMGIEPEAAKAVAAVVPKAALLPAPDLVKSRKVAAPTIDWGRVSKDLDAVDRILHVLGKQIDRLDDNAKLSTAARIKLDRLRKDEEDIELLMLAL